MGGRIEILVMMIMMMMMMDRREWRILSLNQ